MSLYCFLSVRCSSIFVMVMNHETIDMTPKMTKTVCEISPPSMMVWNIFRNSLGACVSAAMEGVSSVQYLVSKQMQKSYFANILRLSMLAASCDTTQPAIDALRSKLVTACISCAT